MVEGSDGRPFVHPLYIYPVKRLSLLLALPFLLAAQTPTVVTWSAGVIRSGASRAPGQSVLKIRGRIAPGWHVYSLSQKPGGPKALSFALEPVAGFSLGAAKGPAAQRSYDAEFRMETETYSGAPVFLIPIRWTSPLPAGARELHVTVRYQACSDKLCLPPRKETLTVSVTGASAR